MPSDEQKKAAAAKRSREYRARKRTSGSRPAPSTSHPAADERDAPPRHTASAIEAAVLESLDAMKWLQLSDGAARAMALQSARTIDTLVERDDDKLLARISQERQTLIRILHELGGTPTVRMQQELRSRRFTTHATEDADELSSNSAEPREAAGGTVTKFQRPARRR